MRIFDSLDISENEIISAQNDSMKLYILLPVHNRKPITQHFIECLCNQSFQDFHLILIDDGSTDGTTEMVASVIESSRLTVINGCGDWWWAGSLQQGLNWLNRNPSHDDDIILIINDDVEIPADFLETGCQALVNTEKTLLQATIHNDVTKEIVDRGFIFNITTLSFQGVQHNQNINCLTTNGLFLYRKELRNLGGFYPHLLPHYLSDYEFTMRAVKKGFDLKVSSELKLYWNRGSTGYHKIEKTRLLIFIKQFFSKKSPDNPVYWTSFIFLACPLKYIPWHLSIILYRTFKTFIFQLRPNLS